jgi:hypothetical protein
LTLAGIVSILRARRKPGTQPLNDEAEKRRAATLETERRLASYLAERAATHDRDLGRPE